MFEATLKCKTLEINYSNDCFRFRFYSPQMDNNSPVQRQYVTKLPSNILSALLERLWQALKSDYSYEELINIGNLLYKQIIPQELAFELERESEGVIIMSEEQSIPWELLHDGEDFIGIRHMLGRCLVWNLKEKTLEDKKHMNCLIISNPTDDLQEAEKETVSLMSFLRKHKLTCKYLARSEASLDGILVELNSCNYDIIHYSGHVVKTEAGEYAFALANQQYLTVNAINKLSFGRTLVFINGCTSGKIDISFRQDPTQVEIEGVAVPFISAGAIAVIGSLVKISDKGARQFAEVFYTSLLEGNTIGSSMSIARLKMKDLSGEVDNVWASFVLYGNPVLSYMKESEVPVRNISSSNKINLNNLIKKNTDTNIKDNPRSEKKVIEDLMKKNKRLKIVNFVLGFSLVFSIVFSIGLSILYKDFVSSRDININADTGLITHTPTFAADSKSLVTMTKNGLVIQNLSIESIQAHFDKNVGHYFIEIKFNRLVSEQEKDFLYTNKLIHLYRKIDDYKYENFFSYWNAKPSWKEEGKKTIRVIESESLQPSANVQKLIYVAKIEGQKEIISPVIYVSPEKKSLIKGVNNKPVVTQKTSDKTDDKDEPVKATPNPKYTASPYVSDAQVTSESAEISVTPGTTNTTETSKIPDVSNFKDPQENSDRNIEQ